jgi:hypothetical protein
VMSVVASQPAVEGKVIPGAGAVLSSPKNTVSAEPRLLQCPLLRQVADVGPGLDPLHSRRREQSGGEHALPEHRNPCLALAAAGRCPRRWPDCSLRARTQQPTGAPDPQPTPSRSTTGFEPSSPRHPFSAYQRSKPFDGATQRTQTGPTTLSERPPDWANGGDRGPRGSSTATSTWGRTVSMRPLTHPVPLVCPRCRRDLDYAT